MRQARLAISLAAIMACFFAGPLHAQSGALTPLSSAAGNAFNGSIDFGTLGGNGTMIPSGTPVAISGWPCMAANFATGDGLPLQVLVQGPGWGGNFAPGTSVLWTSGYYVGSVWKGNGPLTLTFQAAQGPSCGASTTGTGTGSGKHHSGGDEDDRDSQPGGGPTANSGLSVNGIGFQIQSDMWGPFTATLCAFDSANNLLLCHTFAGMSNYNSDNSAIFAGLLAGPGGANIAKLTISSNDNDFGIAGPVIQAAGGGSSPGIWGWWPLHEESGIIAHDLSGGNDDGTLQGTAFFTPDAQRGNVLSITGVSGEVEMPFQSTLEPALGTLSVWVKPTQIGDAEIIGHATDLLVRSNRSGNFEAYALRITAGGAEAIVANDDPKTSAQQPQIVVCGAKHALGVNEWVQLVMRWDGSQLSLFVNGREVAAAAYNANPLTGLSYHGSAPLKIAGGADENGNLLEYTGEVSDLRLYSRALSDAEIKALYSGQ